MEDKDRLKLLEYWVDNPKETLKIPKELEEKISNEDMGALLIEIKPSRDSTGSRSIQGPEFFNHAEKIRRKIKDNLEIESIELQKNSSKHKQNLTE